MCVAQYSTSSLFFHNIQLSAFSRSPAGPDFGAWLRTHFRSCPQKDLRLTNCFLWRSITSRRKICHIPTCRVLTCLPIGNDNKGFPESLTTGALVVPGKKCAYANGTIELILAQRNGRLDERIYLRKKTKSFINSIYAKIHTSRSRLS